jgi:hypothetical protein
MNNCEFYLFQYHSPFERVTLLINKMADAEGQQYIWSFFLAFLVFIAIYLSNKGLASNKAASRPSSPAATASTDYNSTESEPVYSDDKNDDGPSGSDRDSIEPKVKSPPPKARTSPTTSRSPPKKGAPPGFTTERSALATSTSSTTASMAPPPGFSAPRSSPPSHLRPPPGFTSPYKRTANSTPAPSTGLGLGLEGSGNHTGNHTLCKRCDKPIATNIQAICDQISHLQLCGVCRQKFWWYSEAQNGFDPDKEFNNLEGISKEETDALARMEVDIFYRLYGEDCELDKFPCRFLKDEDALPSIPCLPFTSLSLSVSASIPNVVLYSPPIPFMLDLFLMGQPCYGASTTPIRFGVYR